MYGISKEAISRFPFSPNSTRSHSSIDRTRYPQEQDKNREELKLDPNKPTFISPEELDKVPRGFNGSPVNYILFPNFNRESSTGGVRLLESIRGIQEMTSSQIPIGYVGYTISQFPKGINILHIPQESVPVEESESFAITSLKNAINAIPENAIVGIVTTSETDLTLWSLKEALARSSNLKQKFIFLGGEATFAIPSEPSDVPRNERVEKTLSYREKMTSDENIHTHFAIITPGYINPERLDNGEAPSNTYCFTSSAPYRNSEIDRFINLQRTERSTLKTYASSLLLQEGHLKLAEAMMDNDTWHIRITANNELWQRNKIGSWWTEEQFSDSVKKTHILAQALSTLGEKLADRGKGKIVLSGFNGLVDILKTFDLKHTYSIGEYSHDSPPGIYVAGIPKLPHEEYLVVQAAQDIVIQRTTQANSYIEASLTGAVNLLYTMPAEGYMFAEDMDKSLSEKYGLIYIPSDTCSSTLSDTIATTLFDDEVRQQVLKNQNSMILASFNDQRKNFFQLIAHIFDISS